MVKRMGETMTRKIREKERETDTEISRPSEDGPRRIIKIRYHTVFFQL